MKACSEAEFQRTLIEALGLFGWRTNHVRRSIARAGAWMTTTSSNGWPDIVALRRGWVLALEVKSAKGRIRPEQIVWLQEFAQNPYALCYVLRPSDDWSMITAMLQKPHEAVKCFGWPCVASAESASRV